MTKRNLAGSQHKDDAQLTAEREDLELQVTTQVTTQVTSNKNRCRNTQVTEKNLAGTQPRSETPITRKSAQAQDQDQPQVQIQVQVQAQAQAQNAAIVNPVTGRNLAAKSRVTTEPL